MYDELVKRLRRYVEIERSEHHGAELEAEAADAIEELSRTKEELAKQVAYWQARLTESMCGETLAELEKPRWIPVTEGFPKDRVPVQVCYIGMNTGTVESDLLACRYYGAWCYWDGEPCSYDECKVEITHWMPLTRPPKEEEND